MHSYIAVDLGAGSGRVILGELLPESLRLTDLWRFHSPMRMQDEHLRWSTAEILREILRGLSSMGPRIDAARSIGVDTWGVDYGLIDARGTLLEEPIAYRDPRTQGVMEQVFQVVPRDEIYRRTGIQMMPINTLFQWYAHAHSGRWPRAAHRLLMMPDLFHHMLCGSTVGEYTNATTSQMLDLKARDWDRDLCRRLGLPDEVLPPLVQAGSVLGVLRESLQKEHGLPPLRVVAPATHDTASAVVGTPLSSNEAFISSGTWSLVGVETEAPLVTQVSFAQNFTNEGGVLGTNRLLKNVTGMWILESCRKVWKEKGTDFEHEEMQRRMAQALPFQGLIAPDDPAFFNPDDMVEAVRGVLSRTGQSDLSDPAVLSRIILESVAVRYAAVLRTIERLRGHRLERVRIIGGGCQNDFLNQATADASGLEVLAGPVEATAIGSIVVQAIADGRFESLAKAREYVARTFPARRFVPRPDSRWQESLERQEKMEVRSTP